MIGSVTGSSSGASVLATVEYHSPAGAAVSSALRRLRPGCILQSLTGVHGTLMDLPTTLQADRSLYFAEAAADAQLVCTAHSPARAYLLWPAMQATPDWLHASWTPVRGSEVKVRRCCGVDEFCRCTSSCSQGCSSRKVTTAQASQELTAGSILDQGHEWLYDGSGTCAMSAEHCQRVVVNLCPLHPTIRCAGEASPSSSVPGSTSPTSAAPMKSSRCCCTPLPATAVCCLLAGSCRCQGLHPSAHLTAACGSHHAGCSSYPQ